MKHERTIPHPDMTPLATYVTRAQIMLCDLLLWCADRLGACWRDRGWRAEMLEELRHLRRASAMLVFMAAHRQWIAPAPGKRTHRPPNAPNGFARPRWRHGRRAVWRIVASGRGLRGRIEALRRTMANFRTLVARTLARLQQRMPVAAYVMTRAPMERCAALARVEECDVDSS